MLFGVTNCPPCLRHLMRRSSFFLQMVGNSLRGVEEEVGVFSADVDDEDMLFPCLDFALRVRKTCMAAFRVGCCSAVTRCVSTRPFLTYVLQSKRVPGGCLYIQNCSGRGKDRLAIPNPVKKCFSCLFLCGRQALPVDVIPNLVDTICTSSILDLGSASVDFVTCVCACFQVLSILCRSEEVLGSAAGRNILRRCLADAFSDGMHAHATSCRTPERSVGYWR